MIVEPLTLTIEVDIGLLQELLGNFKSSSHHLDKESKNTMALLMSENLLKALYKDYEEGLTEVIAMNLLEN